MSDDEEDPPFADASETLDAPTPAPASSELPGAAEEDAPQAAESAEDRQQPPRN